jgi:radical SAM protein with 4Fe4S-binding SPASM domain
MSAENVDFLVKEFTNLQVIRVVVTGGEPLIVPDLAINLADQCVRAGMGVTLNSNMSKFTRNIGEELQRIGVDTIMTSLLADTPELQDQITQIPGSWQRSSNGIRLAISMGFRVLVNMVLTKWNISRVQQTGDLVGSWKAAKFGATRACAPGPIAGDFTDNLISIDELRESLRILYGLHEKWGYDVDVFEHYPWCAMQDIEKYRYLARRRCTAGVTSASIGADGQLRPCGHSSMKYGNVFVEGLAPPWERMSDWRKQQYVGSCSSCRLLKVCSGGCPVEASNSPTAKDHHCTGPEDVVALPKMIALPAVEYGQIFEFNHSLILRKEVFGGIIASAHTGLAFLDIDAFDAMKDLSSGKGLVSVEVLESKGATAEEAKALLGRLLKEGLIKERRFV